MQVQQDQSYDVIGAPRQVTRDPISIFKLIKEENSGKKEEREKLLKKLREELPNGFKIGAAVGKGDCFFDSAAQGLNELKSNGLITSDKGFNAKSLRRSCKEYAQKELSALQNDSWLNKSLNRESEKLLEYIPRIEFTAEDIKNPSSDSEVKILKLKDAIWGRLKIEGKMICEEYGVKIKVIELRGEEIDGLHVTEDDVGTGDNIIYIVNYRNHFVPLLSSIEKDIEEAIEVSREEIYGVVGDRNSPSLIYDFEERAEQQLQVQAQSNHHSLQDKIHLTAIDIYHRLNQVTFGSDDSGNSGKWSDIDHINNFMNKAIANNDNQLAYYIGPINFGFNKEEAVRDSLKHICQRVGDGSAINDHYGTELDKPFIFIANTETVLTNDSTGIDKKEGGSHWISWVLLPKKYRNLLGEEINNDQYQLFFFDSLAEKKVPERLKEGLTKGTTFVEDQTTLALLPFCKENEIVFNDNNQLTGQQMNGSDCGWWAVYYALMTVYTGGVEFLNTWQGKKLSAVPLRNIMNLQEANIIEQESLQNKENRLPDRRNGEHRSGSINEIQRKSSRLEERTSTKSQNKRSHASGSRLLDEDFEKNLTGNDYQLCLKNYTISDIAKHIYGWTESSNIIFGVEGCGRLLGKLEEFKKNKDKTLIYIINKDGNHWVTLVAIHNNRQGDIFFYADSHGENIDRCLVNGLSRGNTGSNTQNKASYGNKVNQYSVDRSSQSIKENSDDVIFVEETAPLKQDGNDNIRMSLDGFLESKGYLKNNIHSVSCKQHGDGYNCGVFALENAKAILNVVGNGDYDTAKVKESLEGVGKDPESLNSLREEFAKILKKILNSTAAKRSKISSGFNGSSKNLFSQLVKKLGSKKLRMTHLKDLIEKFSKKCVLLYDEMPLSRLLLGQFLCENEDWRDTNKLDKYLLLYPENKSIAFLLISRIKSLVFNIIENKEKASKKDNSTLKLIPKIDILLSNSDKLAILDLEKKEASSQVSTREVSMADIEKGSEVKFAPVDKMLISTDLLGRFENEIKFREEVIGKLDEVDKVFDRAALMRDPVDYQAVLTGLLMDYCNKMSLSDKEAKLIISSSIGPGISIWLHKNTANNSGYISALEQQENGIQTKSSSVSKLSSPIASKKVKDVKGAQGEYYAFLNRKYKIFSLRADAQGDRAISSRLGIHENREKSIINLKDFDCNDLHLAIAKDKIDDVEELIVTNEDYIEGYDTYGNTPLHFAVQKDDLRIFNALMGHIGTKDQKESYVVTENFDRYTPLHFAASSGNAEVVNKLLDLVDEKTEDYVKSKNNKGETPLHFAARSGNVKVVEELLQYVNDKEGYVRAETSKKETPLHFAARSGNVKVVEELLNHVNDKEDYVKSKNTNKCTPLHFAARSGNVKVVEELLNHINDKEDYVRAETSEKETPLHFATSVVKSNVEVILSLIRCVTKEQKKQKYVTCKNDLGYTPLHFAARHGNAEVVNKLLDLVDEETREDYVKSKNNKGGTPLHFAARGGNVKVVEELLKHVNDKEDYVRAETSEKETPLHIAARHGNAEVVNKLLDLVDEETREDYVKSKNNKGGTPLHFAARGGNVKVVEELLKHVNDKEDYVRAETSEKETPLHIAARHGNAEVVNKLLDLVDEETREDYVKSKNNKGGTPLHFAARGDNVKVVQKLLQCIGEDEKENYIKFANNDNKKVLDIAVSYGSWKVFYELLKYIKNPEQKQHYLDLAKQASGSEDANYGLGDKESVEKRNIHNSDNLQTKGCVKERKEQHGNSPYSQSEGPISSYSKKRPHISDGNTQELPVKKVTLDDSLRESGPKTNDSRSNTIGSREGKQPTSDNVSDKSSSDKGSIYSVSGQNSGSSGDAEIANVPTNLSDIPLPPIANVPTNLSDILLTPIANVPTNPDVNYRTSGNTNGNTPLRFAVRSGNLAEVKILLKKGADVNAKDETYFMTPLHYATVYGHKEIVELLIEKGADVNAKDETDFTTLHYATVYGHKEIVELLIEKGADVNAKDETDFMTPLHYATVYGHKEIVELLIEKGADVNAKDETDFTPLHYATVYGHKEIVELLIEKGADVNAKDETDFTPLHCAAASGHKEIVELLIEKGADVNAKDETDFTPLHCAAASGHKEIVELLIEKGAEPESALSGVTLDNQLKGRAASLPY
ncbi:hypothetical protein wHmcTK_11110 [Wolbachia pipientis]